MKVLMYCTDTCGLKKYSEFLVRALQNQRGPNFKVILSNKIENYDFDIIHIQFEHMLFQPFGLGLIPLLIKLKLKGKKIIITSHTTLSKKEIYARNKYITFIKKFLFPLDEKLMGLLSDKIIAHTSYAKEIMLKDYKISDKKVEVICHGVY